jgi:ribosome-associated protein
MNDFDHDEYEEAGKSKSQRKREMTALQDMGRQLVDFNDQQLAQFPLSEDLRNAFRDYKRIKSNEAKRRQMQYIGKLMRSEDQEGIEAVFERFAAERHHSVQQEHLAESWRERLLEDETGDQLTGFFDDYPDCDRQELRNLVRSAAQERKAGKPPAQARRLFRLLREIISSDR